MLDLLNSSRALAVQSGHTAERMEGSRTLKRIVFAALGSAAVFCSYPVGLLAEPVAVIRSPQPGTKFRKGQMIPVSVDVHGGNAVRWHLELEAANETPVLIASGSGVLSDAIVAELQAMVFAGQSAQLILSVEDAAADAVARTHFRVADPQFTLIPLQAGDFSQPGYSIYSVDGTGTQVLYSSGEDDPAPLTIVHRDTGVREVLRINLGNTQGVKLSGNGRRLFYDGFFSPSAFGLGYLDLASKSETFVDSNADAVLAVDMAGRTLVYEGQIADTHQYFLFDGATGERRQITNDPSAIVPSADCPNMSGSTPVITADGSMVVFVTSATLGIAALDPKVGCRVFAYDVASQTLRYVVALPSTWLHASLPSLSADGRWLSFPARESSAIWPVAVLIDVQTGQISAPAVDVGDFVVFDSLVTRDGKGLILSTTADLDPRVGNEDHNLELFYYDRGTQAFTQMSETLGGIGNANGCPQYLPSASDDGGVAVFEFQVFSGGGCGLDGPQRNEIDGLRFGFTRTVRNRPGNGPVVLDQVADQRVAAGETLRLTFSAHDPDGDPISFFAQAKNGIDIPPGSMITDRYDGTATFQWATKPADAGEHVLTVAAFDEGGGEMFQDIRISIIPAGATTCVGSCDGGNEVGVNDLIKMVNIALEISVLGTCNAGDANHDKVITIEEVLVAVQNALNGCDGTR